MATRYEVRLKNQAGAIVSRIPDGVIRSLEYTKRVNSPGGYSLRLDGDSSVVDLFTLDGQLEVWRRDQAASPEIPWYLDFEAFHRIESRETTDEGLSVYVSQGVGYLQLLDRRHILFQQQTAGAAKNGAGETVIKAYVNENGGPGAVAPPRLFAGVLQDLTIQADGAAGDSWEGDRAYKKLLDTIREIADATAIDFQLIGTGPATFEFQAKAKPLGVDRTTTGLASGTGLNVAGNPPVIFALGFGNMSNPIYALNRVAEINAVAVMGQGALSNRVVVQRTTTAVSDSPWNRLEGTQNANQEADTAALNVVGDAALDKLQAAETFTFGVIQTNSSRLGRDYFLGDQVTASYKDIERNKQIIAVTISLREGREDISIELGDVT